MRLSAPNNRVDVRVRAFNGGKVKRDEGGISPVQQARRRAVVLRGACGFNPVMRQKQMEEQGQRTCMYASRPQMLEEHGCGSGSKPALVYLQQRRL